MPVWSHQTCFFWDTSIMWQTMLFKCKTPKQYRCFPIAEWDFWNILKAEASRSSQDISFPLWSSSIPLSAHIKDVSFSSVPCCFYVRGGVLNTFYLEMFFAASLQHHSRWIYQIPPQIHRDQYSVICSCQSINLYFWDSNLSRKVISIQVLQWRQLILSLCNSMYLEPQDTEGR